MEREREREREGWRDGVTLYNYSMFQRIVNLIIPLFAHAHAL